MPVRQRQRHSKMVWKMVPVAFFTHQMFEKQLMNVAVVTMSQQSTRDANTLDVHNCDWLQQAQSWACDTREGACAAADLRYVGVLGTRFVDKPMTTRVDHRCIRPALHGTNAKVISDTRQLSLAKLSISGASTFATSSVASRRRLRDAQLDKPVSRKRLPTTDGRLERSQQSEGAC